MQKRALLFLKAVILDDLGLEEKAVGLVFGLDKHTGFFRLAFFDLESQSQTNQQRIARRRL